MPAVWAFAHLGPGLSGGFLIALAPLLVFLQAGVTVLTCVALFDWDLLFTVALIYTSRGLSPTALPLRFVLCGENLG